MLHSRDRGLGAGCLAISLACLPACARYELIDVKAQGAHLSAAVPRRDPDYLIVRVDNPGHEPLFVDWSTAHVRGPDGFEVPVAVVPEQPLGFLYPAARIEYELYPVHYYNGPSAPGERRVALSRHLVPLDAFRRYPDGFRITLRLRVCAGAYADCWTDDGKSRNAAWRTAALDGVVRRVQ